MNQHIWILNHYASDTYFDHGGRHYSFAKYLKHFGRMPVIFCCNAVHNGSGYYFQDKSLWHVHLAEEIQVPFVFVKGRSYVGNGLGRVFNLIDFYRNVKSAAKEYAKENGKPDIILASSFHPLTLVAGIQLARYFHVKCICEVRDLFPETFISYGILKANNTITFAFRRLEKWIYEESDAIVFTMAGAYDYVKENRWEKDIPLSKVHFINNGVDLEGFDFNKEHYQIDDSDLQNDSKFNIIYTGSIRFVNNLGKLLDVAKCIQNPNVKFLIWGKGNELSALEQRVADENIGNVIFKGYVDKKYIPYITSCADLNLAHGQNSAIMRFGMSLNKMFDYMAAGKPILTDFSGNYNPTVQCGAGIDLKNPTVENIAKAIDDFSDLDAETYATYCRNARKGAKQYDFKNLTKKLLDILENEALSQRGRNVYMEMI